MVKSAQVGLWLSLTRPCGHSASAPRAILRPWSSVPSVESILLGQVEEEGPGVGLPCGVLGQESAKRQ